MGVFDGVSEGWSSPSLPTKGMLSNPKDSSPTPPLTSSPVINEGLMVEDMYNRFIQAETMDTSSSLKDNGEYWRRTIAPETPDGSTAFGPVQITGGLFKDVKKRSKQFNISEGDQKYLDFFISQAGKFSHYGKRTDREGYHPAFDYTSQGGGQGYLGDTSSPSLDKLGGADKIKEAYKRIAKKIIKKNLKDSDGDVDRAIELWRGVGEADDPNYWKKFKR